MLMYSVDALCRESVLTSPSPAALGRAGCCAAVCTFSCSQHRIELLQGSGGEVMYRAVDEELATKLEGLTYAVAMEQQAPRCGMSVFAHEQRLCRRVRACAQA